MAAADQSGVREIMLHFPRLVLGARIQQLLNTVKTGGRLVKHARYYWLLLAESHSRRSRSGRKGYGKDEKRPQRRRFGIYWPVAGKAKWKS